MGPSTLPGGWGNKCVHLPIDGVEARNGLFESRKFRNAKNWKRQKIASGNERLCGRVIQNLNWTFKQNTFRLLLKRELSIGGKIRKKTRDRKEVGDPIMSVKTKFHWYIHTPQAIINTISDILEYRKLTTNAKKHSAQSLLQFGAMR